MTIKELCKLNGANNLSTEMFVAFLCFRCQGKKKNNAASACEDKVFFLNARMASGCTSSSIIVFSADENRGNFDVADVDSSREKQTWRFLPDW